MRRQRGIALISAVIMMSVLLILLGAFLQINRGQMWLINAGESRSVASAACQAGYDYVVYRLEHNKQWAAAGQPWGNADSASNLNLTAREVTSPTAHSVTGELGEMGATFTADIENNLNGAGAIGGLPAACARVHVVGRAPDGTTRGITCLVHLAPLYDASAVAQGSIRINSEKFNIRSKDRWRNQVRAKKDVVIPDVVTGSKTQFLKPDSTEKDGMGLMWSQSAIMSGTTALNATNLAQANTHSGGKFVPGAAQHFEIYELGADSIETPATTTEMPPGKYSFATVDATVSVNVNYSADVGGLTGTVSKDDAQTYERKIQVLEYFANPTDTVPTKVWRAADRTDDLGIPPTSEITYGLFGGKSVDAPVGEIEITNLNIHYDTGTPPQVIIGDMASLDSTGKVQADLYTQAVSIADGINVVVGGGTDGGLVLNSEREGQKPVLTLGASGNRAAILAKDTVDLSNVITNGVGTLISKSGNVVLKPTGQDFEVDATAANFGGLVLYAGQNVTVENPDSGGNWDFKGLVYAQNNFNFEANGANATVEGAVVAHDGDINFNNGKQVDFIYNPDYLKAMVKALPNARTKIERLYWRE